MIKKSISVGLCLKTKNNELSFVKGKNLLKESQLEGQGLQESKHDSHQSFRTKWKEMKEVNKMRKKWLKVWHYKFVFHQQIVICVKSNNLKKKNIINNTNSMNIFTEQK